MLSVRERKDQNGVSLEGGHHSVMVVVVVMIVIMIFIVLIMVMAIVMAMVIVMVIFVVVVMSHVGGHDTRQAGRSMRMVVAVPGLSRNRTGRERHSAETRSGANNERYDSFV